MKYNTLVGVVTAILAVSNAHAEVAKGDDLKAKQQLVGGGLAIGYGLDHCDIGATPDQRTQFDAKMKDLKQQTGMTGALSAAETKDIIGLKSADEEKMFCTGLKLTFPNMLAGFLAEKPPKEWGKGETKVAAAASASTPSKAAVEGWDVEPIAGAPGVCQIAHGYKDKDDNNAENAVVIRGTADSFILALSYARWNWTAGEKMTASLTTPDDVLQGDAAWTADTTGKVLVTKLPLSAQGALAKAEEMTVKFTDGDAGFEAPKLGEAIEAMKTCAASHK